jgi:hypothetical protein
VSGGFTRRRRGTGYGAPTPSRSQARALVLVVAFALTPELAGEAIGAVVDPDLALEAVEQIKGCIHLSCRQQLTAACLPRIAFLLRCVYERRYAHTFNALTFEACTRTRTLAIGPLYLPM